VTTSLGTTEETLALCSPDGGGDISINLSVVESMFYAVQNNKLFWILFLAGILQVKRKNINNNKLSRLGNHLI